MGAGGGDDAAVIRTAAGATNWTTSAAAHTGADIADRIDHADLAARFGAAADDISAEFRRKLAGLRGRMTPGERAAIRALLYERDAAMRALRERRPLRNEFSRIKRVL